MNDRDIDKLKNSRLENSDTDRISYNTEIDEELAKSIKKLVEEETNVARAYIDSSIGSSSSQVKRNRSLETDVTNLESSQTMKTQIIPPLSERNIAVNKDTQIINKEEVVEKSLGTTHGDSEEEFSLEEPDIFDDQLDDSFDDDDNTLDLPDVRTATKKTEGTKSAKKSGNYSEKVNTNKHGTGKKKLSRKRKYLIAGMAALVVLLIAVIIFAVVVINNNNKQSFHYNYTKGMEYFNSKDDRDAIKYLENALKTNDGKNNTDLMYTLYECYSNLGDDSNALNTLKRIISSDKYNEKGLRALGQYYYAHSDGSSLNDLISQYRNTDGEKYLQDFEVAQPTSSDAPGEYKDSLQLKLTAQNGQKIYYTTDGSDPTTNSKQYSDTIVLTKGTTIVKAIAVNDMGVNSSIVELKYVVDYKQPDAPQINPESGTYDSGQMITIDNIADGDTAYYTLDGTTPTIASTKYTGSFAMPEGNKVVSAIIVSQHDLTSSVTRRNYVVSVSKTYTFDEAVNILKNRMVTLNVLKAGGTTTADGSTASFVYLSQKTINNVAMYYIRYDVKKNGATSTMGYYGVALKDGQCYKVTENSGNFTAENY